MKFFYYIIISSILISCNKYNPTVFDKSCEINKFQGDYIIADVVMSRAVDIDSASIVIVDGKLSLLYEQQTRINGYHIFYTSKVECGQSVVKVKSSDSSALTQHLYFEWRQFIPKKLVLVIAQVVHDKDTTAKYYYFKK